MAYVAQTWTLSAAQVLAWRMVAAQTDLTPGPGGSRIVRIGPVEVEDQRGQGAFVALYPSSQLVAHRDPPIAGTRYHVPLDVNEGCWVFHAGMWQQLEVGMVYEMDPTQVHGAVNWGDRLRLHLLMDVEG